MFCCQVGMLFLFMVFSATYTANLAAFLTAPSYTVLGPQTMEELKQAAVCARWTDPGSVAGLQQFSREVVLPPTDGSVAPGRRGHWWARAQLQHGACDAIVDILVDAKAESLEHCSTMQLSPNLQFDPVYDVGIMRDTNSSLFHNVTTAIGRLVTGPAYSAMLSRHLQYDRSCTDAMRSGQTASSSSSETGIERITVKQMGGAFIVFGVAGILAVVVTLVQEFRQRWCGFGFGPNKEQHRGGRAGEGAGVGEPREEVHNEELDLKLDRLLDGMLAQQKALAELTLSSSGTGSSAAVLARAPPENSKINQVAV
jgi:hypothetical protein